MMARVPRCEDCGRRMEYDDAARDYHCPECDADVVDEVTAEPEGFPVWEYDEEDRA